MQGIELLRGVAAFMVLLAHHELQFARRPAWLGFSQTGVDLFFVLSGFVFGPWLFGRRVDPPPHLLRRLFHIYPLYLVALAGYVALHWEQGQPPLYLLDHVFMLHTLSRDVAQQYNAAFWSLPVEVEFYLLLPLLSWFVRHGAGFGPLLVLALGLHFAEPASGADPLRAFVAAHLGLLAALGYAGITIAVVAHLQRRPLHRGLVRWTGNLSYGVYLFHNGAITLLVMAFALKGLPLVAGALLLTLAMAGLGFVAVERPARQAGRALAAAVVLQRSRLPALA